MKGLRRGTGGGLFLWGVDPLYATCVRTSRTTTSAASNSAALRPACRPAGRTRTSRGSSSIRSWRRLPDIAVRTRRRARLTGALTLLVVSASWPRMRPIRRRSSDNSPYKEYISLRTMRRKHVDLAGYFTPHTTHSPRKCSTGGALRSAPHRHNAHAPRMQSLYAPRREKPPASA